MSIYETSITNPKKQLEFYKQISEQLQRENANLKKDIEFCLHSIKQEMEMSTDERTRTEMKPCYEILRRYINESRLCT